MARAKDPKSIAQKYARNAKNAVNDYEQGVMGVATAPGQAAVAKKDKFRANLLESIDDGTWEANTAAVPLQTWQKATVGKGKQNFPGGVDAAVPKVEAFIGNLLQAQASIKQELDRMDDSTPEARIQRAVFWMREMKKFKGSL